VGGLDKRKRCHMKPCLGLACGLKAISGGDAPAGECCKPSGLSNFCILHFRSAFSHKPSSGLFIPVPHCRSTRVQIIVVETWSRNACSITLRWGTDSRNSCASKRRFASSP